MKTSEKITFAALFTLVATFAIVGVVDLFTWLGGFGAIASASVFFVIIAALMFGSFYNAISEHSKNIAPDDEEEDDGDSDYGRGVNLGEIDLGEMDLSKHESDYEAIKKEEDLQPFEKRLFEESSQLDTRILALEAFVKTEKFKSLELRQAALLITQMKVMKFYFAVLSARMVTLGLIKAKE